MLKIVYIGLILSISVNASTSLCLAYYSNYLDTAKLVARYAVQGETTLAKLEASGLTVIYKATLKECAGDNSIIENTKSIYNNVKNLGVL